MSEPTQVPTLYPTFSSGTSTTFDDNWDDDDEMGVIVGAAVGGSIGFFLLSFCTIYCLVYYTRHYHDNSLPNNPSSAQSNDHLPPPAVDGVAAFVMHSPQDEPVMATVVHASPLYADATVEVALTHQQPSAPPVASMEMEMGVMMMTMMAPASQGVERQDTADLPVASPMQKR